MNIADAIAVCDRVTYKKGWAIECSVNSDVLVLRLSFLAPCAVTGREDIQVCSQHGFNSAMLECMDEAAFCNRLLWVFRQAEEHEMLEFFKLDGVAIYDPHKR